MPGSIRPPPPTGAACGAAAGASASALRGTAADAASAAASAPPPAPGRLFSFSGRLSDATSWVASESSCSTSSGAGWTKLRPADETAERSEPTSLSSPRVASSKVSVVGLLAGLSEYRSIRSTSAATAAAVANFDTNECSSIFSDELRFSKSFSRQVAMKFANSDDHFLRSLRSGGLFRGISNSALIGCRSDSGGSVSAISIAVMPSDHTSLR
mmetsp:Transcript_8177/g.20894  ORF Transcript_8177/g.20894 Transcript_8177/m.20894 type:complete len:213 (-) Transcript_8177:757-1395(-)